jgi:hypothetical protein
MWRAPRGGALIGAYWDYHWQKWQEWVLDTGHSALWRPAAVYIARQSSRPGHPVVRVTLVRNTSLNNPPGSQPASEPTRSERYYTLRITPAALDGGRAR